MDQHSREVDQILCFYIFGSEVSARNKNALCIKRRAFTIQRDAVQRIPELEKSETMHVSVSLVYWSEWNVY